MSSKLHNAAQKWKPLRSTWIVGGIAALFLVALLPVGGGISVWVLLIGLLLLITAAYSLVFRRRSWVAFSSGKGAKIGLASGAAALLIGFVGVGLTGPDPAVAEPVASPSTIPSAAASPTPTPSATPRIIVGGTCPKAGVTQTGAPIVAASPSSSASASSAASPSASPSTKTGAVVVTFVCAEDENQKFVWMEQHVADKLKADRLAAAEQAESERVAAEEAAEQQRLADEAAAAAESQRLAQEQSAAAEAQRMAEEQARQQYVQPAPAPAPAPAPEPAPVPAGPNVVHPGAFCSGGVGVSKTGKPMVCAPASDGRMRWISQ